MKILVIGAGAMGSGIAQVLSQAGEHVAVYDTKPEMLEKAEGRLAQTLETLVAKGKFTADEALGCIENIDVESGLSLLPRATPEVEQRLIDAHLGAQRGESRVHQAAGRVFNCATGDAITLLDLVNEINRQTGQSLVPIHQPSRAGDIQHSRADISAIQSALGYQVRTTWQEGLARTLGFYRGQ
jgi:nucleoside-diphosphate-sugar epimerase